MTGLPTRRGPPPKFGEASARVQVRLPPRVIEHFKEQGDGDFSTGVVRRMRRATEERRETERHYEALQRMAQSREKEQRDHAVKMHNLSVARKAVGNLRRRVTQLENRLLRTPNGPVRQRIESMIERLSSDSAVDDEIARALRANPPPDLPT